MLSIRHSSSDRQYSIVGRGAGSHGSVKQLAKALKLPRIRDFRNRSRSTHRRMYEIQRMTTRQRHEQQTEKYRELIEIVEEVVTSATSAVETTATMHATDLPTALKIETAPTSSIIAASARG
jgi:hypothetical protein